MQAFLKIHPFDEYHFFLPHPSDVEELEEELKSNAPDLWDAGCFNVRLHRDFPGAMQEVDYYCVHLSDPFTRFADVMSLRNAFSRRIFPLTAPTHSLSYAEYGRDFLQHLWAGATGRDAVVATSTAGVEVVRNYYSAIRRNYRLDAQFFFEPSVRHIPLGVEPSDMPSPDEKAALSSCCRKKLGLADEVVVYLLFARLSYQSKMDLLPVLRAFKRAESEGLASGSYALLLAGWVDDDDPFPQEVKKLAANLGINCVISARPDNETRKALYAAADVFISPSDNLQETFGLTMLEAAVSSLPVIASHFDGYKDLVVDGETGILVPTIGPDSVPATDALGDIVPASEYHLLQAQQCVVDATAFGLALARLGINADLRHSMGAAGRRRALESYTWRKVVEQYIDLWAELNDTPCELPEEPLLRPHEAVFHPARMHSMEIFGNYYTLRLNELAASGKKLVWTKAGEAVYRNLDFPVVYRLIESRVSEDRLRRLLFMARKPVPAAELRAALYNMLEPGIIHDHDFLLLWALKHDLLELAV